MIDEKKFYELLNKYKVPEIVETENGDRFYKIETGNNELMQNIEKCYFINERPKILEITFRRDKVARFGFCFLTYSLSRYTEFINKIDKILEELKQ